MAHLAKVNRTRYVIGKGKDARYVDKNTAGARKVQEESEMWYAVFLEGTKKERIPLATDRTVAQVKLGELIKARERGEAGLLRNPHLDKPLSQHVAEYLATLQTEGCSPKHLAEKGRLLAEIEDKCGMDLPTNGGHPVKGVKSPWEVHPGTKAARLHP